MPPPATTTHVPNDFTIPGDELTVPTPELQTGASPTECECPFPWWLLLIGAAVGGVAGYAAGKRSKKDEEPFEEAPL